LVLDTVHTYQCIVLSRFKVPSYPVISLSNRAIIHGSFLESHGACSEEVPLPGSARDTARSRVCVTAARQPRVGCRRCQGVRCSRCADVVNINPAEVSANLADTDARGDIAELMRLIQSASLNELRTTYNGGYGASLFRSARGRHLFELCKADRATGRCRFRRTRLQAQTANIERMIGLSEDRAKRLQADLDVARDRQAKIAEYQLCARSDLLRRAIPRQAFLARDQAAGRPGARRSARAARRKGKGAIAAASGATTGAATAAAERSRVAFGKVAGV
jgi:hypothetical protein